ncbi:MAG: nitroreductase family deazaflavin-dependent oxidoreductase [Microbacteriaceae bacterium]
MGSTLGAWNFRQKPTGLFKAALKFPVYLFRARLGFLFGQRLLMITHVGRKSKRIRQTVVEVVEHDANTGEYIVCSGVRGGSDWYRNLRANPAVPVQVGNRRWRPTARFLHPMEAERRFARYEQAHPAVAKRLLAKMGLEYDGTDEGRLEMMERMPMLAFSSPPGRPPAS